MYLLAGISYGSLLNNKFIGNTGIYSLFSSQTFAKFFKQNRMAFLPGTKINGEIWKLS